jgi:hypothetical protein
MTANAIRIAATARLAFPWLPEKAPAASVWIGPAGEVVRVLQDGEVQPWPPLALALPHPCKRRATP